MSNWRARLLRRYGETVNTWDEDARSPWVAEDFRFVRLLKNIDFNYHVDIADLLSDKSLISSRSQWIYEYDRQAHRSLYGYFPTGPAPTSKSAIITYLQKEQINVKEIIDTIQDGSLPKEERVMVAVPKEREFKESARFYGKMTFSMRLFQVATEKNIADGIFPFVKHQSMTMSEEELTKTILRMNTPTLQLKGEPYVFITLDFSSWCTNFRHELVTPLFEELDALFDLTDVYAFTHVFPMISILLFQNRFFPPQQGMNGDPIDGPRCYTAPEAWLEGLRQKGWTLATILIILLASWKCGTSASLLGQGDNQVILLRIPPDDFLRDKSLTSDSYVQSFLKVLKEKCEAAGIQIKLEETWYSRNLFEYSRRYHYRGAQVSGALKKISRLASEANQTIPTLSGDLSGIFSTGASSAAEDLTPRSAYFCTIVEASLSFLNAQSWALKEPFEYVCCIFLVTRCLGGYPITLYSQFCTRAVQDVLSSNLHLIKTVKADKLLGPHIARVVTLECGKQDFLSLIKDPQSLPLNLPIQPENYLRREIKRG